MKLLPSELEEITRVVISNIKENFVLVPKNQDEITVVLNNNIFQHKTLGFIASQTGITVEEIKGKQMTQEICEARRLFSFFCVNYGSRTLTYEKIAEYINIKNHASVTYHLGIMEKLREKDYTYNKYIGNMIIEYKKSMEIK